MGSLASKAKTNCARPWRNWPRVQGRTGQSFGLIDQTVRRAGALAPPLQLLTRTVMSCASVASPLISPNVSTQNSVKTCWLRKSITAPTLSGRLSIKWETQAGLLLLAWEETGGPPVQKPTSKGFGTTNVIASVESQLGGQAEFDWRSEGLICRLSVPLSPNFWSPILVKR